MKPAPFDYIRCDHVDEALEALHRHGEEARIIAGGQSLVAMLNMRLVQPSLLVDISRIGALKKLDASAKTFRVNAAVTQSELLAWKSLAGHAPLLARAMPFIGHVQTRNRGTVCGSLAHADPSSELPLVAVLLNATIHLAGKNDNRSIAARDFFIGLLETSRRPDELLTAVEVPICDAGREGFAFDEVAMRHGDFAIIAMAVRATRDTLTIGVGGASSKPEVREFALLEGTALDDALNAFAWELPMQDDVHASARYRRDLVRRLGPRLVMEARQCLN